MGSQSKKDSAKKEIIKNLSMYGLRNRLFFVNKFSLKENAMEGITVLEQDKQQNITKKIVASKGIWQDGIWTFYNSITYEFDNNGQIKGEPAYFEQEIMTITETPADFLNQMQLPEFMNISQLNDYIYRLSKSGAETVVKNLKVDLYQRFTSPFTSLVIIIVGIPFALKIKKRVTALASFGICFVVGFLYYVSNAISIAFGKAGFLPPLLAVSLSHVIFFLWGIYLVYNLP
jgi:lipopolysaccharide export system permease protein